MIRAETSPSPCSQNLSSAPRAKILAVRGKYLVAKYSRRIIETVGPCGIALSVRCLSPSTKTLTFVGGCGLPSLPASYSYVILLSLRISARFRSRNCSMVYSDAIAEKFMNRNRIATNFSIGHSGKGSENPVVHDLPTRIGNDFPSSIVEQMSVTAGPESLFGGSLEIDMGGGEGPMGLSASR